MTNILQTTSLNAFSWKRSLVFWFEIHRNMFRRVSLSIIHHWLSNGLVLHWWQAIVLTNGDPVRTCISVTRLSRFNTSGPDPLGFDWEDLAASRGTVGGHSGHPPWNSLGIDSRNEYIYHYIIYIIIFICILIKYYLTQIKVILLIFWYHKSLYHNPSHTLCKSLIPWDPFH